MKKIIYTFDEYDAICERLQKEREPAKGYVPTLIDYKAEILPNLEDRIEDLIWIDITGYDTETNAGMRSRIHKLLINCISLVETKPTIFCTYDDYDKYCELFESMAFHATDYVPTQAELQNIVLPDLKEYILFLIWIDVTGYDTEENKEVRKQIRKIIRENMSLYDAEDVK